MSNGLLDLHIEPIFIESLTFQVQACCRGSILEMPHKLMLKQDSAIFQGVRLNI
jgi:hypothetical protein